MGDMREEFDALRAHLGAKRAARAVVNIESLKALGVPATEQSKNVFRVNTPRAVRSCITRPAVSGSTKAR